MKKNLWYENLYKKTVQNNAHKYSTHMDRDYLINKYIANFSASLKIKKYINVKK